MSKLLDIGRILNVNFNFIAINGKGYPRKIVPYEKGENLLSKKDYAGVDGISLVASPVDSNEPAYDWFVYVHYLVNEFGRELIFCVDDNVIQFNSEGFKNLIIELSLFGDFDYGISYRREYANGPEIYSRGGIKESIDNPLSKAEKDAITKWLHDSYNRKSFKEGILRDVYPYNLLSSGYLNKFINSLTLRQWIVENEGHGKLYPLSERFELWEVPYDSLMQIRQELNMRGILLCYVEGVSPTL
ncbi:hypothetical protein ACQ86N_41155 [Puia sp. P3]|uniref:hypothetical protein n=1 Tax=Puia sp. P3 TaxID=3423952 RepID=UPI003D6682AD